MPNSTPMSDEGFDAYVEAGTLSMRVLVALDRNRPSASLPVLMVSVYHSYGDYEQRRSLSQAIVSLMKRGRVSLSGVEYSLTHRANSELSRMVNGFRSMPERLKAAVTDRRRDCTVQDVMVYAKMSPETVSIIEMGHRASTRSVERYIASVERIGRENRSNQRSGKREQAVQNAPLRSRMPPVKRVAVPRGE